MRYKIGKILYDKYIIVFGIITLINMIVILITRNPISTLIYLLVASLYHFWYEHSMKKGVYKRNIRDSQGPQGDPGKDYGLTEDDKNEIVDILADKMNVGIISAVKIDKISDSEKMYPYVRIKEPKLPSKGDEIWFITNDFTIDHMIVDDPEEAVKNILNGCCFYKSEDKAKECLENHKNARSVSQEEIFRIKQQMMTNESASNGDISYSI